MNWVLASTAGILFGVGIFQLLQRDAIRLTLGFSLILGATNLFLLSSGIFDGRMPPYAEYGEAMVDPVPQALVLTAIVIGFGVMALLLSMVLAAARALSTLDVDALDRLSG